MRTSGQHVKSRTYPPTKSPPPSSTLDPSCERHHYSSITQTRNLKAIFHCSASLMPHIPKMQEGKERVSHLAVSISLWLHRLELARPLCPWDSPGKNTGVGSDYLNHGIFLTQELNWSLLNCSQILYWLSYERSTFVSLLYILLYIVREILKFIIFMNYILIWMFYFFLTWLVHFIPLKHLFLTFNFIAASFNLKSCFLIHFVYISWSPDNLTIFWNFPSFLHFFWFL